MTDQQWELLKPLLPLERLGPGRPLELDMRAVVDAIFYLVRTGCQWDDCLKISESVACTITSTDRTGWDMAGHQPYVAPT
jgi:transposase